MSDLAKRDTAHAEALGQAQIGVARTHYSKSVQACDWAKPHLGLLLGRLHDVILPDLAQRAIRGALAWRARLPEGLLALGHPGLQAPLCAAAVEWPRGRGVRVGIEQAGPRVGCRVEGLGDALARLATQLLAELPAVLVRVWHVLRRLAADRALGERVAAAAPAWRVDVEISLAFDGSCVFCGVFVLPVGPEETHVAHARAWVTRARTACTTLY